MAKEKDKDKDNEKVYTIPLRDAWKGPCKKRAKKCLYVIREFVKRHMKTEKVKVGTALNHEIWACGIKNPPRKLKVQVVPHEDVVWVELQGVKLELEKKEEKKKKAAEETKEEESKEKPVKKGDAEKKGVQAVSEKKEEVGEEKKEAEAKPASKKEAPEKKDAKKKEVSGSEKKQDPSEKLPPKAKLH